MGWIVSPDMRHLGAWVRFPLFASLITSILSLLRTPQKFIRHATFENSYCSPISEMTPCDPYLAGLPSPYLSLSDRFLRPDRFFGGYYCVYRNWQRRSDDVDVISGFLLFRREMRSLLPWKWGKEVVNISEMVCRGLHEVERYLKIRCGHVH